VKPFLKRLLKLLAWIDTGQHWWAWPYYAAMCLLITVALLFLGCAAQRKLADWHPGKPCHPRRSEVQAICGKWGMHDPETHLEIWGGGPEVYCVENYRDGARASAVLAGNPPPPFHCDGDTQP